MAAAAWGLGQAAQTRRCSGVASTVTRSLQGGEVERAEVQEAPRGPMFGTGENSVRSRREVWGHFGTRQWVVPRVACTACDPHFHTLLP